MSGRLKLADGDANSRRARKSLQEVSEEAVRYSGKKLSAKVLKVFHSSLLTDSVLPHMTQQQEFPVLPNVVVPFPFIFRCCAEIPDIAHIATTRFSFRPVAVDGGRK